MAETPTHTDRLAAIRHVAQLLRSQSRTTLIVGGLLDWTPTADERTHFEAADALTYLLERVERLEAALRDLTAVAFTATEARLSLLMIGNGAPVHEELQERCERIDKALKQARAALAPDAPHREPHAQETA